MGLLKAVNAKTGKVVLAKAQDYSKAFPANKVAEVKSKVAQCVNNNNKSIKKEAGKSAKSWVGFSNCMIKQVMTINPC